VTRPSLAPREHFPALAEHTYLNTAAIALSPLPVLGEIERFQRQVAANGTLGLDDEAEARMFDEPRRRVAGLVGGREEDVAITSSATEALSQLAWGLFPGRGSNVVSADIDFPSVTYPWLRLARTSGVEVRLVRALGDPTGFSVDRVAELVDGATAAICLSHVQYGTGHRLDPRALAELAHAHGALLILDATQAAGVIPIDAPALDQDVVIASAYKWLCGPLGGAFCWLRPEVWERFEPPFLAARSTARPFDFDARTIELAPSARRLEYATISYAAAIGVGAAIDYLTAFGIERVRDHVLGLGTRLMDGLDDLGAEVVTPREDDRRAGIVNARFPGKAAEALVERLVAERVHVTPRLGGIRFSPHLYNDEAEVDRALEVLANALVATDPAA
jgi:cysteine desulfurase/selenocysteine lyase